MTDISLDELNGLLHDCRQAQRVETQPFYATDQPIIGRMPPEVPGWADFLELVAELHSQGQQRSRICILPDPVNDYWAWRQRAMPWHIRAGETVYYLDRSATTWLPRHYDWWLIDGHTAVQLWFTPGGKLRRLRKLTSPGDVAAYQHWWELAILRATPAAPEPVSAS